MKYKYLNLKYALINVFYFMLVCGTAGYANNFLQYKGISTGMIGMILTAVSILALIGQTAFAPIIDRSKTLNEKKFIIGTLIAAIVMFVLILVMSNATLVSVCTVLGFALAAMGIPYLNSIAFIYEQEGQTINYGLGRGVGSSAYAIAGLCIGQLINWRDASVLPYWLIVMAGLTIFMVSTLQVPEKQIAEKQEEEKKMSYIAFFKKYSDITWVIVAMVLNFFCHMLLNNFMINIIEDIGGNAGHQGTATFIQALVELPTMFGFALLLKKFKVDSLFAWASIFYSIKHIIILFAPNITVFYIAMVLQMVSYALIIPASVYFADQHVDAADRNQGQAIMTATTTVGGLFASFFGGMLISSLGIHTAFLIGTIVSVIGTVVMNYGIRKLQAK